MVSVHMRGALAARTRRLGRGVGCLRDRYLRAGHDGTQGHYVGDLARGGVQKVRRDC